LRSSAARAHASLFFCSDIDVLSNRGTGLPLSGH
jgi:hypothetical protein